MQKIKLEIEALDVESFTPAEADAPVGTVNGHEDRPSGTLSGCWSQCFVETDCCFPETHDCTFYC